MYQSCNECSHKYTCEVDTIDCKFIDPTVVVVSKKKLMQQLAIKDAEIQKLKTQLLEYKNVEKIAQSCDDVVKVYINPDGYYPQCRKCGYSDLEYLEEKCPQCGCKQDWSDVLKK